jgi:hypothetical protein
MYWPEGSVNLLDGESRQWSNRVYPASTENSESSLTPFAELEHVDGAHQIVLHQLPAIGLAVDSSQDTRVGCCIYDPVDLR